MKRYSLGALILSWLLILYFASYYPKWKKEGNEATITYDVAGYYLPLPALFIYHDPGKLSFYDEIQNKYHPTELNNIAAPLPDGNYTFKYPLGAAVMYSPFFFIAHGIANFTSYNEDGYSYPYQLLLGMGCLFYVFTGLWLFRKILLTYFDELTSGITILLIVAATNFLNYAAIDVAMTHSLLFTVYACIVWFTIQFYKNPSLHKAFWIGICCGLATIIRPSEIISVLIPVLWGISSWETFKLRVLFFIRQFKSTLLFIAGVIVIGSIQLIYWKYSTGHLFYYSYGDQGFDWLHPHLKNGLFSYRKGWLIYTPFMLLLLPGFFYLLKHKKEIFIPVFLFIILNIYIVFSWEIWWYGGSLGQRSMVQSYLLLSFPIASVIQQLRKSKWLLKLIAVLFIAFCTWFNLVLTLQAHSRLSIYESENMNKTYFWAIFGKLHTPGDMKKYLDTDERFRGERKNITQLYFNNIENDTLHVDTTSVISGKKCLFVDKENQGTQPYALPVPPSGSKWLRISADFYFPWKEWDTWKMTQFTISFKNKDEVVKTKFIRLQRIMSEKEIKNISFDVQIPDKSFDNIEFYLWNANGASTVYMDNIRVESFN